MEERFSAIQDEIKGLSTHIEVLEKTHRSLSQDVQELTSQNDKFATQQKSLSNSMRKLERNLEDMTDNLKV